MKAAILVFVSSALLSVLSVPQALAADANIPFHGTDYHHRWSQNNQNEFTPDPQVDLNAWQDMVTINVYPGVKDGEALATTANLIMVKYQEHGKLLRTNSKERTATKPAEHMAVALLGDPKFLEAVFARFMLIDQVGYGFIYSHRVYGEKVGPEMSKWLKDNGATVEADLMSFDKMPALKSLKELPQSK